MSPLTPTPIAGVPRADGTPPLPDDPLSTASPRLRRWLAKLAAGDRAESRPATRTARRVKAVVR